MAWKNLGMLRIALIVVMVTVVCGCSVKRQQIVAEELSGKLFSKDIGCSIYFIWAKAREKEGVKQYVHEIDDLYRVTSDGELHRLYEPQVGREPNRIKLANYHYPILIDEYGCGIQIMGENNILRELISFDFEEFVLFDICRISDDGTIALLRGCRVTDGDVIDTLMLLDCNSGEIIWETEEPWPDERWGFRGLDSTLSYGLISIEMKEGSYSKEVHIWWEPYIVNFPENGEITYRKFELPGGAPFGANEAIMLRDGRIIALEHDGVNVRFYETNQPYTDFRLIYEGPMDVPEIVSSSRDGDRMVLSLHQDNDQTQYCVFETSTGKLQEFFLSEEGMNCSRPQLNPDGNRLVFLSNIRDNKTRERSTYISIYDPEKMELIEKVEWEHGGYLPEFSIGI